MRLLIVVALSEEDVRGLGSPQPIRPKEVVVMEVYRLYHVWTAKSKPGKRDEAKKWWLEKGKPLLESVPGAKSVRAYAVQFGLGGEYFLEMWVEKENYAVYDRVDEDVLANPQKYAAWSEAEDVLEWGPSRLMGDWPESQFPLGEE